MTSKKAILEEFHVGTEAVFVDAGFTEVSRPTLRRAVMRIDFCPIPFGDAVSSRLLAAGDRFLRRVRIILGDPVATRLVPASLQRLDAGASEVGPPLTWSRTRKESASRRWSRRPWWARTITTVACGLLGFVMSQVPR